MAPKFGSVITCATHQPNHDYPVGPEWITSLWQQGKMTAQDAKIQYVRTKRTVQKYVDNVSYQARFTEVQIV
jgi:hypothetical protein